MFVSCITGVLGAEILRGGTLPAGVLRSRVLMVRVALEELRDTLALPDADAEDDNADDRKGGNKGGVFDKAGADIVRERDNREATEKDDNHKLADRDRGQAGDIANNIIGKAREKKNKEEGEGGAFGVDEEVKAVDGGFFENLLEERATEAAGDFEDDEAANKGTD